MHAISQNQTTASEGKIPFLVRKSILDELGLFFYNRPITEGKDFISLGLHEDNIPHVRRKLCERFSFEFPTSDMFIQYASVDSLTDFVLKKFEKENRVKQQFLSREETSEAVRYELSYVQKSLWHIFQMAPDNNAYTIVLAGILTNPFEPEPFKKACHYLLERHPILKSRLQIDDGGVPFMVIDEKVSNWLHVERVPSMPSIKAYMETKAKIPFNLMEGPLFRVFVIIEENGAEYVVGCFNHIVNDAYSCNNLVKEFLKAYQAIRAHEAPSLPEVGVDYITFIQEQNDWLKSKEGAESLTFYKNQLNGANLELQIHPDFPQPESFLLEGATAPIIEYSKDRMEALRSLARQSNVSFMKFLYATYALFLHKITAQDSMVLGTPMLSRPSFQYLEAIGFFNNMIPIRTDYHPDMNVLEWIEQVGNQLKETMKHELYPFPKLVEEMGIKRSLRNPVFQSVFVYYNESLLSVLDEECVKEEVIPVNVEFQEGQFELSLEVNEYADRLVLKLQYQTHVFHQKTVAAWRNAFSTLLNSILDNPSLPLRELSLVPSLKEISGVQTPTHSKTIFDELASTINEKNMAFQAGKKAISYADFYKNILGCAAFLSSKGVRKGDRVGIEKVPTYHAFAMQFASWQLGAVSAWVSPEDEMVESFIDLSGINYLVGSSAFTQDLKLKTVKVQKIEVDENFVTPTPSDDSTLHVIDPKEIAHIDFQLNTFGEVEVLHFTHQTLFEAASVQADFLKKQEVHAVTMLDAMAYFPTMIWGALMNKSTYIFEIDEIKSIHSPFLVETSLEQWKTYPEERKEEIIEKCALTLFVEEKVTIDEFVNLSNSKQKKSFSVAWKPKGFSHPVFLSTPQDQVLTNHLDLGEINPGGLTYILDRHGFESPVGAQGNLCLEPGLFPEEMKDRKGLQERGQWVKHPTEEKKHLINTGLRARIRHDEHVELLSIKEEDSNFFVQLEGTYTIEPYIKPFEICLSEPERRVNVASGGYNQLLSKLMDPLSALYSDKEGVNFGLVCIEDSLKYQDGEKKTADVLHSFQSLLKKGLQVYEQQSHKPFILFISQRNQDQNDLELRQQLDQLIGDLLDEVKPMKNVFAYTERDVLKEDRIPSLWDKGGDQEAHIPFTTPYYSAIAAFLARKYEQVQTKGKKIIVLDCDHTLWKGVVGEDGPDGVEFDAARQAFHHDLLRLKNEGVILCLASKNNEKDALAVFEQKQKATENQKKVPAQWKLKHLGVVCENIEATEQLIKQLYEVRSQSRLVHDETENSHAVLYHLAGGLTIKLVSGGLMANYYPNEQSMSHVCYEVGDLESEIKQLLDEQCELIAEPKPTPLFDGRKVAFLNTPLGIVELLERGAEGENEVNDFRPKIGYMSANRQGCISFIHKTMGATDPTNEFDEYGQQVSRIDYLDQRIECTILNQHQKETESSHYYHICEVANITAKRQELTKAGFAHLLADHGSSLWLASPIGWVHYSAKIPDTYQNERLISLDDVVDYRINWEPKSGNVRDMIEGLNLNIKDAVFIDDSLHECHEMRINCPEVTTLWLPREEKKIANFLKKTWLFDHGGTEEDGKRTAMYQEERQRKSLENQMDYHQFLEELEVETTIREPTPQELARLAQLTQRSNQFNANKQEMSESELVAFQQSGGKVKRVSVKDKFGSYGITGMFSYSVSDKEMVVDQFLLSCRVLSRGVEQHIMKTLAEEASKAGLQEFLIKVRKTDRNQVIWQFFDTLPSKYIGESLVFQCSEIAHLENASKIEKAAKAKKVSTQENTSHQSVRQLERNVFQKRELHTHLMNRLTHNVKEEVTSSQYVAPVTETEKTLVSLWQDALGVAKVGIHDDYFALGGNSLLAAQLIYPIRKSFQVEVPLASLFQKPTVYTLAKSIERLQKGEQEVQDIDLVGESAVPKDIQIKGKQIRNQPVSAVLLTGSTGFLGAFLLQELLEQTSTTVYCIVRAKNDEEALERLIGNLEKHQIAFDEHKDRIRAVAGDLSKPKFGLQNEAYDRLTEKVGAIYHCGAFVNFVYLYDMLRDANVAGTQEVLRFATREALIPIHFISTIGVFNEAKMKPEDEAKEEDLTDKEEQVVIGGYAQSKWVAERMLGRAKQEGMPVTIYRPGIITPPMDRPAHLELSDFANTVLYTSIMELQALPDTVGNMYIDFASVDYISQSCVALSKVEENTGAIFHLTNQKPIPVGQLISVFEQEGQHIKLMNREQWIDSARKLTETTKNPYLSGFMPIFEDIIPEVGVSWFDFGLRKPFILTEKTKVALDKLKVKNRPISNAWVRKLMQDMRI
ncbi:MAG: thioester reductase domain-containing protein [Bacteroidota bacterium]